MTNGTQDINVVLVDNKAGADEPCANCGTREEWMDEIQPHAFPNDAMILCPGCLETLARLLITLVRNNRHRPNLAQVRRAFEVPEHIRKRAEANEREENERAGGAP